MNLKPILITAFCLPATLAWATVFTSNTTIAVGDATYDGQPIVVSNCTLTVNGPHSFASLALTNAAVLTHSPAPNGETNNCLDLTIANDAVVDATSRIDASGGGYGTGAGPGAGGNSGNSFGGGAGHGGNGGGGTGNGAGAGGSANDLILTPADFGSGGGYGYLAGGGGRGGGYVRLNVGGTLMVAGQIRADAAPGSGERSWWGGGAGGTIFLTAGTLDGAGSISANGGSAGSVTEGGGGGGGHIAITWTNSTFSGSYSAVGGAGYVAGGAGTIFTRAASDPNGTLVVDNGSLAGAWTPLTSPGIFALQIRSGAVVQPLAPLTNASLLVGTNGTITCAVGQTGVVMSVLGNATIEAGGAVVVSGCGYGAGAGPGAGIDNNSGNGGGGGSHGGQGGQGLHGPGGGSVYDLITTPNQWGSGGGAGYQSIPGAGGGWVRLVVGGVLQVNGQLAADGATSTRPNFVGSSYAGGGSGGALWLTVGGLTGTGTISANGGAGINGGGGGGGRIAIYHGANSFSGSLTVTGGTGFQRGGAGTIFTRDTAAAHGQVLVDNSGYSGAPTVLNSTLWQAGEAFDLIASGAAVVYPEGAVTLANLRVNGGAILSHAVQARTFNLTVISNAVIETNGQINVAGLGYPVQTGPGAGGYADNGNAGGGGHGGHGGGAQIPYGFQGGGGTYDSPTQPADFGSGGGGSGGAGGGAIRMDVFGTLQLDGQINAAGASVVDAHYGGGAGGSIWLQLGTLTGSGFVTTAGGWSGGPGGGGGGGRVAIYSRSFSGFDTNRINALGGSGGTYGGCGADGTIRLLSLGQTTPPLTFTRGSGQALLVWPGFSGLQYQLLTTTNLAAPNWVATGAPLAGLGGWLSNSVPITSIPEQYFRLQVIEE